jgi:type IV pilus assembly protein PilO
MTLDDFRRLNFREVGKWPLAPKIIVLALVVLFIVALGAYFDWKDQWDSLQTAEQEEGRLRDQFKEKKAKAINYDLYVQQLAEVEQSFGALVKQLPNRSEIDALLTDINQAGLGRGLQFELFKPGQVVIKDFYAELPIAIKVSGRYHDIGSFAADIANLSRIVTLHNLNISAGKDLSGVLTMESTARTYRYLDQNEIEEMRKATAAAKAKAGGKP